MLPKSRMGAKVAGLLACVLGFAATGGVSNAATLTGMVAFTANSSGRVSLGPIYNTLGGDLVPNLYVTSGGSFLNSGNGAKTSISVPLTAGSHTFALYGDAELPFVPSYVGLNLFFDGQTNPGISVFAAINSTAFKADGNSKTPRLTSIPPFTGLLAPGSNSLTYGDVTLTGFSFKAPNILKQDKVSLFDNKTDCENDFVGSLTLNVASPPAPVPVPPALPLLASALGLTGLLARRKGRPTA